MSMVYPLLVKLRDDAYLEMNVLDVARRLDADETPYIRSRVVRLSWYRHFYVLVNDTSVNNLSFVRNLYAQCLALTECAFRGARPFVVVARNVSSPTITPSTRAQVLSLAVERERYNMPRVYVSNFAGTLYRVAVDTDAQLRRLETFFRENATQYADVYAVPGYMDDLLRVSLDVYALTSPNSVVAGCSGCSSSSSSSLSAPSSKKRKQGRISGESPYCEPIDLFASFSTCRWFFVDERDALCPTVPVAVQDYNRFRSYYSTYFDEEPVLATLWDNPLRLCSRVIWDIETVAVGRGTIPRGTRSDERLSSIAILIEGGISRGGRACSHRSAVALYLKPFRCRDEDGGGWTPRDRLRVIEDDDPTLRDRPHPERRLASNVSMGYDDERQLLHDFVLFMRTNVLVEREHLHFDRAAVGWMPCVALVGYNTIGYDFQFVVDRCAFFGMWDDVDAMCQVSEQWNSTTHRPRRFDMTRLNEAVAFSYVFNARQVNVDLFRFLQTRFPLSSYTLRNVLRHFSCAVEKMDFNSTEIRRMYYDMGDSGATPDLATVLRYNLYDCLAVAALYEALHFADYVVVMARYFRSDIERAMYKGNSCNIPPRLMCEALRRKNELVPYHRPERAPFVLSARRAVRIAPATSSVSHLFRPASWISARGGENESASAVELYEYAAPVLYLPNASASLSSAPSDPRSHFFACSNETDVVRVLDRTYIGGLNMSFACHARDPTCVDFDSFYPSVMRHFDIYVDNVRVFRVGELLLSFGGPENLDRVLRFGYLRLFDYEPETSTRRVWREDVGSAMGPWYEGMELRDSATILATSVSADRRVMALFRRDDEGTLKMVLTDSLRRRDALKKRLRDPNLPDSERALVKCHEQMEKVFSNSIYGSLNYSRGLLYRPSAAACVTLLCRKTTREAMRIARDIGFSTIYVDTDGFVVVPRRRDGGDRVNIATSSAGAAASGKFDSRYVNVGLGLEHVNLSNENDDAVSVSIFGDKKYSLAHADGTVKLTGYEKNAPPPIRRVFALLTRIVHFAVVARSPRGVFRARVQDPVAFFLAFYECVWHTANDLHARGQRADERTRARVDGRLDGRAISRLDEYCVNVPLNSRGGGGGEPAGQNSSLSRFIERTIRERGYAQGERARAAFVEPIAAAPTSSAVAATTTNTTKRRRDPTYVLYEDLVADARSTIDLYGLARNYVRYALQTVEGHRRDDWRDDFALEAYAAWSRDRRRDFFKRGEKSADKGADKGVDKGGEVSGELRSARVDQRYKRLFSSETLRRVESLGAEARVPVEDANCVREAEYAVEIARVYGLEYVRVDENAIDLTR